MSGINYFEVENQFLGNDQNESRQKTIRQLQSVIASTRVIFEGRRMDEWRATHEIHQEG